MFGLVAVDVGNRRMKFGWFGRGLAEQSGPSSLPEPESVFSLEHQQEDWSRLEAWLESVAAGSSLDESETRPAPKEAQTPQHPDQPGCQAPPEPTGYVQPAPIHPDQSVCPGPGERPVHAQPRAIQPDCPAYHGPRGGAKWSWWIGSVNRPATARLVRWISQHWPQTPRKLLQWTDLPIPVRVQQPERAGIDRLLNAVAANRLRVPDRPAVVIDVGTAITVDWLSADGAFCGGAILPGLEMAAKALHQFTDLLPEVAFTPTDEPPPALGTYTEAAIRSGLFWGAVGAIRELIVQLERQASASPQVFVTGGAGGLLVPQLGPAVRHVPHLTLSGMAISALAKIFPSH